MSGSKGIDVASLSARFEFEIDNKGTEFVSSEVGTGPDAKILIRACFELAALCPGRKHVLTLRPPLRAFSHQRRGSFPFLDREVRSK